MRTTIMRRRALLAGCVLPALLAGCAATQPTRFYTLTPTSEPTAAAARSRKGLVIGLGPVTLPPYLDRPDIVTAQGANQMRLPDVYRWSEPLQPLMTRIMAEDLYALLDANDVIPLPQRGDIRLDRAIEVEVGRFDATRPARSRSTRAGGSTAATADADRQRPLDRDRGQRAGTRLRRHRRRDEPGRRPPQPGDRHGGRRHGAGPRPRPEARPALLTAMRGAWLPGLLLMATAAQADQTDPRLGPLFDQLKAAPDAAAAGTIEIQIWRLWSTTPDPDSEALLVRGSAAMGAGDMRTARAALDLLVTREPTFAEAWNKRATLLYLIGDDDGSVADVRRTLALEPRHFGALSGLGLINARHERPEAALHSFEAALAIHPFLPGAQANVEALREQLKGDPT